MAFTIEFLYEDGKPVKALDDEILDDEKIKTIIKLQVYDIIPLGSGSGKRYYRVKEIHRKFVSGQASRKGEDTTHFDFIVEAIPNKQ